LPLVAGGVARVVGNVPPTSGRKKHDANRAALNFAEIASAVNTPGRKLRRVRRNGGAVSHWCEDGPSGTLVPTRFPLGADRTRSAALPPLLLRKRQWREGTLGKFFHMPVPDDCLASILDCRGSWRAAQQARCPGDSTTAERDRGKRPRKETARLAVFPRIWFGRCTGDESPFGFIRTGGIACPAR